MGRFSEGGARCRWRVCGQGAQSVAESRPASPLRSTSLISATGVVGPLLMTSLFAYFTGQHAPLFLPGAPFLAGSALALLALFIVAGPLRRLPAATPAVAPESQGH